MQKSRFLTVAGLTFAVAACGSLGTNTSMYSVHQPVVERTNYAIDVNVDSGGVTMAERLRMADWFEGLKLGYGDRVAVDYGNSYESASARQTVSELAAEHGILISETAPVTVGQVAPGTVRVVVTRSSASVPSCPDWSTETDANFNSSNHSNFGCSTNSNLAAMIADPEDLIRGRENTKRDNNSGKAAVNAHRAKTTGGN